MSLITSDEQDTRDMARLAGGHDAALNDLMERHSQKVLNYLLRSLQNHEDAADLAQETFVRVYQNRARFNSGQRFSTWLYAIASNLVRDRYRWRSRHPQVSMDAENSDGASSLKEDLADATPTPGETLQREERSATIREAIATLPQDLQQALILAVYEGLPQAQIAEILGCTAKAVETRIYRARNQLRTKLRALVEA